MTNESPGAEGLIAYLEGLGIVTTTVNHPPLYTVSQSMSISALLHCDHRKGRV